MKTLICVPTHDRRIDMDTVATLMSHGCSSEVAITMQARSLLADNFNRMLCKALNEKYDYFCLVHSDIAAEFGWLRKMHEIMKEKELMVLSVVSPLKMPGGITSCAYEVDGKVDNLTLKMIKEKLGITFTAKDVEKVWPGSILLINTGMMLVNLRLFGSHRCIGNPFWFEIVDRVVYTGKDYVQVCIPEDWNFSKQLHENGVPYGATTAIHLTHFGNYSYTNEVL